MDSKKWLALLLVLLTLALMLLSTSLVETERVKGENRGYQAALKQANQVMQHEADIVNQLLFKVQFYEKLLDGRITVEITPLKEVVN